MRRLISIVILCVGILTSANAQTFTQRIQQQKEGQGAVTIHQSDTIDRIVNTATLGTVPTKQATTPAAGNPAGAAASSGTPKATTPRTSASTRHEEGTDSVDTHKKIIRGGTKVTGYRVQAFAGGNSRKDRQQAEAIGNNIKAHYGNVPVYVHFYSPRWICRVGNYRTYEEAHQMLVNLRNLGYTQASIVKGKITVGY